MNRASQTCRIPLNQQYNHNGGPRRKERGRNNSLRNNGLKLPKSDEKTLHIQEGTGSPA